MADIVLGECQECCAEPIQTDCCENPVPSRLHVSITWSMLPSAPGTVGPKTYLLVYDPFPAAGWYTLGFNRCEPDQGAFDVVVYCFDGQWRLTYICDVGSSPDMALTLHSCDPFHASCTFGPNASDGCCLEENEADLVTFDVTE